MIIGELVSADGGTRHKCARKSKLLPDSERLSIIAYIEKKISDEKEWFCYSDFFKDIPKDLKNTPLISIYNKCKERYPEKSEFEIIATTKKNIGIYFRDSIESSQKKYKERFLSSIKQYKEVNE